MRPSTFLIAICAIVISANASSTEKRQLDSSPDICKDTLRQSLARSEQAKKIIRETDVTTNISANIIYQELNPVIENLQLISKYCCKSSGVVVPSKDSEDIYTLFNDYYRIRIYIKQYNSNFHQNDEKKLLMTTLFKDCKKYFNKKNPLAVGIYREYLL